MSLRSPQPPAAPRMSRGHHSVRFTGDDLHKLKSLDGTDSSPAAPSGPRSLPGAGAEPGAPGSADGCQQGYQPAAQRLRLNEQRIKILTSINQVVAQRAELEASRGALAGLLDELRRKLRRRVEDSHVEKKDKMKALKQANQRLEREKFSIMSEVEHLKRHLDREESHHVQHARNVVAQAIQGVVTRTHPSDMFSSCSIADLPNVVSRNVAKNAPSRVADNKLAAARLMRDIAELRQRVAQVEARLATELKRKRQAEVDIMRLRKELSAAKVYMASSLHLPHHNAMRKKKHVYHSLPHILSESS